MSEVYISLDIETTGPAPGMHSMISLGAAAFTKQGEELSQWTANLQELPQAQRHPHTMSWWQTRPQEWEAATTEPQEPREAMEAFAAWLQLLPGRLIPAAWPAAFDFAFVNYYCWRYLNRNPLGFACLDIRSLAMGLTHSKGYYDLRQSQIQQLWQGLDLEGLSEHVALDDAIEQGRLLVALLNYKEGGSERVE